MNEVPQYHKALEERLLKIKKAADEAWLELDAEADRINDERRERARIMNEAPCTVCQGVVYVLKYREVSGSVKGRTTGHFSLFGGSISGYVDGETHTNPVLSCRNCGNEKLLKIADYKYRDDLLQEQLPWHIYSCHPGSEWLKTKGVEVARQLIEDHKPYIGDAYDVRKMSDDTLEKCGLEYKYPLPQKPRFYFIKSLFA